MKTRSTDILICGGGVPGLTLAILMAQEGLSVTLVERTSLPVLKETRPDGRTAALMQGSINILKHTGAWDLAERHGCIMRVLRIVDDQKKGSPVTVDFEAREIGLDYFSVNMPNAILTASLADKAKQLDHLSIIAPGTVDTIQPDDFGVTAMVNGQPIRARLIIGADGRQSAIRDLSSIRATMKSYGQRAICCLIDHSRAHYDISTEFHRSTGPFTLVPLPGQRSSVVWVDFEDAAEQHMALDRAAFTRALQDRSCDALGEVTMIGTPSSWPLMQMKAESLIAPRVALVAEAAHVLHPLGAQGLNLSLRDVAALAETIMDALRVGQDPGTDAVLKTYQRKRAQDMASRTAGTDWLNRVVSTKSPVLNAVRQSVLKTLDHVSLLRHLAMQEGLAPVLKDSRLALGEAL
jgi:2-octaprenyl-6-methoxyphenol hydroxylase